MLTFLKRFLCFICLLGLTYCINFFIYQKDSSGPHLSTLALILLVAVTILNQHKFIRVIGYGIFFVWLLELFFIINLKDNIPISVLNSMVETNSQEAIPMLLHYFIRLFLPAIIIMGFIRYGQKKLFPNKKLAIWLLVLPLGIYGISIYKTINVFKYGDKRFYADIQQVNEALGYALVIRERYPALIGNIYYLMNASNKTDRYSNTQNIQTLNPAITGKNKQSDNPLVILIMGESSSVSRYSKYGYPNQTTPNMDKIFSANNACAILNAHSSAPLTRDSVSMSLAFHSPENDGNLFANQSIIEMAKNNGYKTFWLGAQRLKGMHDSKFGFIAKKSNVVQLVNKDLELPALFEKAIQDSASKKFIIVHLHGSHLPYVNFDEQDKKALLNAEDYDLTIHHTDRVVGALNNILSKNQKNHILIYTSDHGEVVNKGHGIDDNKEQFLIPFLYASSNPSYNCQYLESYRNAHGWISGLMNKYILAELLGYTIDPDIKKREKANDRILTANIEVVPFEQLK